MTIDYVIAPYRTTYAMYELDDFRVDGCSNALTGKFVKTDKVKGMYNGYEIGVFNCDNGLKFVIFKDHTALQII